MVATYTLTVTARDTDNNVLEGANVVVRLNKMDFTTDGTYLPSYQTDTTNASGVATFDLISNIDGSQDSRYIVTIHDPNKGISSEATIQMPQSNSDLNTLVTSQTVNAAGFEAQDHTWTGDNVFSGDVTIQGQDLGSVTDGDVLVGDGAGSLTLESGATLRASIGTPTGTSGAVLGFLNGNNTHSGNNTFSGAVTVTGGTARVEAGTPKYVLDETDGTTTHNEEWILLQNDGQLSFQTRDSTGSFVSEDYRITRGASGATDHQWRIENSEAARIDSNSNLLIGTTTPAEGNPAVDIASGGNALCITSSTADTTTKIGAFIHRHYTNSEEPVLLVRGRSASGNTQIYYGGGDSSYNTAREHSFFTAGDTTTTTGTEQVRLAHNAAYFPGVGTTGTAANAFLDSGSSPTNQLLRSTSSIRYKENIEPVDDWRATDFLTKATPIWYHSLAKADKLQDGSKKSFYSFSAEELAEIDPRLVTWGYDVDDWEEVEIEEPTQVQASHKETRQKDVIEIVDGKAVKKTVTEEVEVKEWLKYPLYDDKGNPIMEVVKEAEYDEEGKLLKEAVTQQAIHREPKIVDSVEVRKERQLKEGATLKPDGVNDRAVIAFLTCEIQRLNEVIKG